MVVLVFEAKYGVIFRPFWRGMLVWRTPKAAREIPLLEMFLGQSQGSLPAKFERNRKIVCPYRLGPLRHALLRPLNRVVIKSDRDSISALS